MDQQGLVGTRGAYVEITEREWDQAVDWSGPRYRPYDRVIGALAADKIVKLSCPSKRQALGARATLRKRARAAKMAIDDKVAQVSTDPEQWALLARRVDA